MATENVIIPGIIRTITIGAASMTTGSGLDDATSAGTYTGTNRSVYLVGVDGTGTPDTFTLYENEELIATGVEMVGSDTPQSLNKGVTIAFTASTGHASGNVWTIVVQGDILIDRSITDPLLAKYIVETDRTLTAILLKTARLHLYTGAVTITATTENDTEVTIDESGTGTSELFANLATLKTSEQAKLDAAIIADAPDPMDSPVDGA